MNRKESSRRARQALDLRLSAVDVTVFEPPHAGWIRAIRDALGMSVVQLGRRMGISGPSVANMESAERAGGIRLSTLRRAAEAMDCTLVYAIVPRRSLDEIVRRRAEQVLETQLGHASHTMALEDQVASLPDAVRDDRIDAIVASNRLWTDPDVGETR